MYDFTVMGLLFALKARAEGREELPSRRPDRDSKENNSQHTRSEPTGISHFRGKEMGNETSWGKGVR